LFIYVANIEALTREMQCHYLETVIEGKRFFGRLFMSAETLTRLE